VGTFELIMERIEEKIFIPNGCTLWARQTLNSEIFLSKPDKWFKIWFYLVNRVNYLERGQYKRGECFLTYQEIMSNTACTRGQLDKFIRWSKLGQMLATRKSTRGMCVSVLKYAIFQNIKSYKDDTKVDAKSTQSRHRVDTIVEEGKKGKKGKKIQVQKKLFGEYESNRYEIMFPVGGRSTIDLGVGQPLGNNQTKIEPNKMNIVHPQKLFGEFVKLSEKEHAKLTERFLPEGVVEKIKALDMYIGSTGKHYESHYYTILKWHNDEEKKKKKEIKADPLAKYSIL